MAAAYHLLGRMMVFGIACLGSGQGMPLGHWCARTLARMEEPGSLVPNGTMLLASQHCAFCVLCRELVLQCIIWKGTGGLASVPM